MQGQTSPSLGTSNRNQMMKEIKTLKEEIEGEQRQQWKMMKTIMQKTSVKAQAEKAAEKAVF